MTDDGRKVLLKRRKKYPRNRSFGSGIIGINPSRWGVYVCTQILDEKVNRVTKTVAKLGSLLSWIGVRKRCIIGVHCYVILRSLHLAQDENQKSVSQERMRTADWDVRFQSNTKR